MIMFNEKWLRTIAIGCVALTIFSSSPLVVLAQYSSTAEANCANNGTQCNQTQNPNTNVVGATAAGLGSCGAGLLAKLLGMLGISAAQAGLGLAKSTLGQTPNPLAVPVYNPNGNLIGLGNSIQNGVTAVSNNVIEGGVLQSIFNNDLLSCIARAIARAIIQQTVIGIVNWARSGFQGSPVFVTDPTTFFMNVANTAAGNFFASNGLSFLCNPFNLQVRIAIANAYANGGQQNSCNLIGNWTNFLNNFGNGGWPQFIAMTSSPTNQPFGAYLAGLDKLNAAVARAQGNYQTQLAYSGGFLNFQQQTNCRVVNTAPADKPNQMITDYSGGPNGESWTVCDVINATPGKVIESQLSKAIGYNLDELNMAKYFDEIISALITGLIMKVMNGGLLTLGLSSNNIPYGSGSVGGITNDATTQLIAQGATQIPGYVSSACQLGGIASDPTCQTTGIYEQDIADVQSAVTATQTTLSCWQGISPATSDSQSGVASSTQDMSTLNQDLSNYQAQEQSASSSVATLLQYQDQFNDTNDTDVTPDVIVTATPPQSTEGSADTNPPAQDLTELQNLVIAFTNALSQGAFPDQGAISAATEDRIGLTATLASINQNESTWLSQCQAAGGKGGGGGPPPKPTCSLVADPPDVFTGQQVQISWSSTNATAGTITNAEGITVGSVTPTATLNSGTLTDTPAGNETYTGTFTGTGGTGTCTSNQVIVTQLPTGG